MQKGDIPMTTWTSDELNRIGTAEELEIASRQDNGVLRKPTTIWVVRLGDGLYVRPVNGHTSGWFRGTQVRHEGHIQAGGIDKDVTFVEVNADDKINDQIDAAYRTKYRRYAANIVNSVLTPKSRAATIKLVPRATTT
jgi:hypothetical protein